MNKTIFHIYIYIYTRISGSRWRATFESFASAHPGPWIMYCHGVFVNALDAQAFLNSHQLCRETWHISAFCVQATDAHVVLIGELPLWCISMSLWAPPILAHRYFFKLVENTFLRENVNKRIGYWGQIVRDLSMMHHKAVWNVHK